MSAMCNLSEGLWNRAYKEGYEIGYKEGRKEQLIICLKAIIKNLHFTFEQAANVLELSEEEKAEYINKM
jgi:flagellar biosynthesis/type III secretory pathway protein FliH